MDPAWLAALTKRFFPYQDHWGAITQLDGDGGDAAYRNALFVILLKLDGQRIAANARWYMWLQNFCESPGVYRRHPDPKKWYSNPNNFSRDQFEKAWLAMCVMNDISIVIATIFRQILRLGFHQNIHKGTDCEGIKCYKIPDLPGIGQVRNFIRTYFWTYSILVSGLIELHFRGTSLLAPVWGVAFSYLILNLLDVGFLADLALRKKQTWDYDSLMLADLLWAQVKRPTLVSIFAGKKYYETDWRDRIKYNYSRTDNDIKPLGDYYIIVAEEILTQREG